jgi:hypothetical protein
LNPPSAYNCNLELLSKFEGDGGDMGFAAIDHCGYLGTPNIRGRESPGVIVVDASDRRTLRSTVSLDAPAMLDPHTSLTANSGRKLLAAVSEAGAPAAFDVYDADDCTRPVLRGNISVPGFKGHAGRFAPDGRTYYGTALRQANPSDNGFIAFDVADPSKPTVLHHWHAPDYAVPHDISISDDGTRAYVSVLGYPLQNGQNNGLAILEVSDIQHRRSDPQVRVLGTVFWTDGGGGQAPIPLRIKGRPHIVYSDWAGPAGGTNIPTAARTACGQSLPPFGFARLIDISDEQHPVVVSKIMLQINDPVNCSAVLNDAAATRGGYSTEMCMPDNPRNAAVLACAWKESGLRIFDIRHPAHPVEIAYYKPMRSRFDQPAHVLGLGTPTGATTPGEGAGDWVIQVARVDLPRNEIWFMSQESGMQIVRFTERFRAKKKELFGSR